MNLTPLYNLHLKEKARMGEFAGWRMPLSYTGVIDEHKAVRDRAGLFDLCHLARFTVAGRGAHYLIQRVTTNDASSLKPGDVQYSLLCNEEGGVLDDVLVYRLDEGYMLVANAVNKMTVLSWLEKWSTETESTDVSGETALVALQGPLSQALLQRLADVELGSIEQFQFRDGTVAGVKTIVSRTGYTGEDGFELYLPSGEVAVVWIELLAARKDHGLQPVGLGARDTLRLEAALPLYGHELSQDITPLEAGLEKYVKMDKGEFIGRRALVKMRTGGLARKLVGFEMIDRAIPRRGHPILKAGERIGEVTSGSFGPTVNKNIGLGYVETRYSEEECDIEIEVRGKALAARLVKTPFYRKER